jgi:CTP synthase
MKTKPTQHSVKELRSIGIQPDVLVCRCQRPLQQAMKEKLSEFCDVPVESVITSPDADSIYEVPLILEKEGLAKQTLQLLEIEPSLPNLEEWQQLIKKMRSPVHCLEIAIVGKYIQLSDAYLSVVEALTHAGIAMESNIKLRWVSAEDIEEQGPQSALQGCSAIVVPGGFGIRGIEGKIRAIEYARTQKIPFLGLCLGMQCSVIEWARHVAKLESPNSAEFDPDTPNPVINLLPEQEDVIDLGGTMRLGIYASRIAANTLAFSLYQQEVIYERHRHRYEFNNAYRNQFLESGYVISGTSPDGRLVEIIELPEHPFFIATQFHPEFHSRPNRPHPVFLGLVKAALTQHSIEEDNTNLSFSVPN